MVSVIVPAFKENFCLPSLFNQTYKDMEIIVVKDKPTPEALNYGIKQSKGDIIIRCDAHAWFPPDYVKNCVKRLLETKADNVGGNCITVPANNTFIAKLVARAMGFGGLFRRGTNKITETDTVWGGCYWRETFSEIGLFDERLKRCQDIEFNLRLKRNGGKIMLCPEIYSFYYPKSTLWGLIKHSFIDGLWTTKILKYDIILQPRHYFPLFFVFGLLVMALGLFMAYV